MGQQAGRMPTRSVKWMTKSILHSSSDLAAEDAIGTETIQQTTKAKNNEKAIEISSSIPFGRCHVWRADRNIRNGTLAILWS